MSDHNNVEPTQLPQASELPNAQTHNLPPVVGSETIKNSLQRVGQYVRDALVSITGNRTPRDMSDIMEHMYPGRGNDLEMMQSSNVGDCYFVAALYGLKHNEIFEHLMRKMVTRDGENWIVQFPDGSLPIIITPDDLKGQKTPHEKTGEPVHRKPIKGGSGDIILERAYGRHLKGGVKKERAKAYEAERTFMVLHDGGFPTEVYKAFLNHIASHDMVFNRRGLTLSDDQSDVMRVEQWLNAAALNPDYIIMAASTPSDMLTPYAREVGGREFSDDKKWMYFMDKEYFFYQQHAYAITAVDAKKRLVTVVNPHDTKRLKKIVSYDDFMKIFDGVFTEKLQPNAVREELGVNLPPWKGSGQGFHFEHEPKVEVEVRRENVEEVLRALAGADELTLEMKVGFLYLTPQELLRIKQKYGTIITTAKFGGRNDPSEVRFAKEVVGCIEEIETLNQRAMDDLDDKKRVYRRIDNED